MDPTQVVVTQLIAIRAAADAALSLLVATETISPAPKPEPPYEPEQEPQGCQHARRRDVSTMGRAAWLCMDCGHEEDANA